MNLNLKRIISSLLILACLVDSSTLQAFAAPGFSVSPVVTASDHNPFSSEALAVQPVFQWFSRVRAAFSVRQELALLLFIPRVSAFPSLARRIIPEPQEFGALTPFIQVWHGIPFVLSVLAAVIFVGYVCLDFASKNQHQPPPPKARFQKINDEIAVLLNEEKLMTQNPNAQEDFRKVLELLDHAANYAEKRGFGRGQAASDIFQDPMESNAPAAASRRVPEWRGSDKLWELLSKNQSLALKYEETLLLLFPDAPAGPFRIAKAVQQIQEAVEAGREPTENQLREFYLASKSVYLQGIANALLVSEKTKPIGILLLAKVLTDRKSSLNVVFLDELNRVDPAMAEQIRNDMEILKVRRQTSLGKFLRKRNQRWSRYMSVLLIGLVMSPFIFAAQVSTLLPQMTTKSRIELRQRSLAEVTPDLKASMLKLETVLKTVKKTRNKEKRRSARVLVQPLYDATKALDKEAYEAYQNLLKIPYQAGASKQSEPSAEAVEQAMEELRREKFYFDVEVMGPFLRLYERVAYVLDQARLFLVDGSKAMVTAPSPEPIKSFPMDRVDIGTRWLLQNLYDQMRELQKARYLKDKATNRAQYAEALTAIRVDEEKASNLMFEVLQTLSEKDLRNWASDHRELDDLPWTKAKEKLHHPKNETTPAVPEPGSRALHASA